MSPTDPDLWRRLRKGDRVTIVHFPFQFSEHEYTMHDDTRAAYQHLIETREVLAVSKIDNLGYPWVEFAMDAENGETEYHSLMLNHDGVELVIED